MYLNALGIHIHDCSLCANAECIKVLPQLTRMAIDGVCYMMHLNTKNF